MMVDREALPQVQTLDQRVEESIDDISPLYLPIEDAQLVAILDKRIAATEGWLKDTFRWNARVTQNENFWKGRQFDENQFYDWQPQYKDNMIWQDLETRISLASAKLPDIITIPSGDDQSALDAADDLQRALEVRVGSETMERLVKDGLRHLHLFLTAAIKIRWDKNNMSGGDYVLDLIHPRKLILDHNGRIPQDGFTADETETIGEWLEEAVSLICAKFPDKAEEFKKKLGISRGTLGQMTNKVRYAELWFDWYDTKGTLHQGVCWKYKDLILGSEKNPYFDWEGYDRPDGKGGVKKVYHNHFDRPRKPYILFSYQNLGNSPYDDTSAVEQAIPLQKQINREGRQISEISARAVPKLAFAGRWITKEDARRITNDPDEHIWLKDNDDVNKGLMYIPAAAPSAALYQGLVADRMQIDSKFATHATTRGETQPSESGTSKQITREGDLSTSDDIVNKCVERVVFECANWGTQMMKLFYDEEHFVRDIGPDGELLKAKMQRDRITDGVLVKVRASSVDKSQMANIAMGLSSRRSIDPYFMFKDLDLPTPKERTRALMTFLSGNFQAYMQEVGIQIDQPQQPQQQSQNPAAEGLHNDQQQALTDLQGLISGRDVEPPSVISPEYLSVFTEYLKHPDFEANPPEVKKKIMTYINDLQKGVKSGSIQTTDQQGSASTNETGAEGPESPVAPTQPVQAQTSQLPAQVAGGNQ